ncbi:MAG: ATP-binding protein [Bdellovibrionaceae bacterium]|nr:ATP-binding protein [Pseudobdellovibrionaceae bacterium]
MFLKSLSYSELEGTGYAWELQGLSLGQVNLVVGKNAKGKTRTLNVITGLGKLLGAQLELQWSSGHYDAEFSDGSDSYRYILSIVNNAVVIEKFIKNGAVLLDRGAGGIGQVFSQTVGKMIAFQAPETQLAAVGRRDQINHPFFEILHQWGASLYYFEFSGNLGKDLVAISQGDSPSVISKFDAPKDTRRVVGIFQAGVTQFGDVFKNRVISEFNSLGYELENVSIDAPAGINFPEVSGRPSWIWVKEKDLPQPIQQAHISNGMFRALSLVIQLVYSDFAYQPSCVIIDDIGEGLDFDRSCKLIELLLAKCSNTSMQLIMASNDRFVMNKVPLESWTVLDRKGHICNVYNYSNSKEKFDEFKFTGLNNFDFLASDFIWESSKE